MHRSRVPSALDAAHEGTRSRIWLALGGVGLPVAFAAGVAGLPSALHALGLGVIAAIGVLGMALAARRLGGLGSWLALLLLSILPGGIGAIAFGGQSGRLLWADLVLAAGLVVVAVRQRLRFEWPRAAHLAVLAPFLAWATVSLFVARDPLTAISELKEWGVAALAAVVAVVYADTPGRVRKLLGMIAVTGALIALHMLAVVATSPAGPVLAVVMKLVDLPWGRSNYLAGLLILALPVTVGLLGSAPRAAGRIVWGLALLAQGAGLAVSASKGAILALVVALGVAYGVDRRAPRAARLAVLALIVGGTLVFAAGPLREVARYRLAAQALDYSTGERLDLYRLAWERFLGQPLFGIGIGNFSVASNRLHGVDTTPHQYSLGFLCELGIPGLVLALGFMGALLLTAWRARSRAADARGRALALGVWAAVLGFAVHNQFESTIYGEQYKLLLVVTAAAAWGLARAPVAKCESMCEMPRSERFT